jgi:hypothetical protein
MIVFKAIQFLDCKCWFMGHLNNEVQFKLTLRSIVFDYPYK